ncbi:MAG: aminotransferase class I/II-fold pyridoxal phosphate-dependent enzyme, partial [Clostridia bacterium]|nr:aminotransferase class I/II-fold pyridoxal phosphate-dependent enzyme [Clostridia bacterium]
MNEASRLKNLPAYLFARIEKKIEQARDQGIDIINLGIGDPVEPTPDYIIATMAREIYNPANHRYPTTVGLKAYRQAIADWYRNYCQIELDPETEIGSLIGSKEGLAHISFCFVNPGDVNLVPDPAYPVYQIGTVLAGGEAYALPLKK